MTTPSSIEERVARLEGSFEQIERSLRAELNVRLDRLETRMDRLDTRMDRLDTRLDQLGGRLDTRIDHLMYWQLGLLGAIAASILATVLTRVL